MPITLYHVLHVTAIILMAAITFQSCADPDESKKRKRMMLGGIAAFIAFVAGFGLLAKAEPAIGGLLAKAEPAIGWPGWVIVKLICFLGIAGLSGAAYRSPSKAGTFSLITAVLVAVAVYCVYYRPF
jgi:hypothetical protein